MRMSTRCPSLTKNLEGSLILVSLNKLDLIHWLLLALSFRMKIFYLIQTSIHVGMSTLKKTTKMGQWYIFATTQQQTQTNICWDKTCVWVMEFKITTLPLLNWHHWTDRKTDKKLFPSFRAHSMHACTQSNCISVARWAILMNQNLRIQKLYFLFVLLMKD